MLALAPLSNQAAARPGRLAPRYALAVPRRRRIDQVADHGHRPGAGTPGRRCLIQPKVAKARALICGSQRRPERSGRHLFSCTLRIWRITRSFGLRQRTWARARQILWSALCRRSGEGWLCSGDCVRVRVLTHVGVLDRTKQLSGRCQGTGRHRRRQAGDAALAGRTGVLITESPHGGWGITGHAGAGARIADIAGAARPELAGNWPSRPAAAPHREGGLPAGTALIRTG